MEWRISRRYLRASTFVFWFILGGVAFLFPFERPRLQKDIIFALEITESTGRMLRFVQENVNSQAPILQIGSSDDFSIEAVRWTLATHSGNKYRDMVVDQYPMTYERLERLRYAQLWRPQEQYRKQIGASLRKVIAAGNYQTLGVCG